MSSSVIQEEDSDAEETTSKKEPGRGRKVRNAEEIHGKSPDS
jgi:hypothetical protein